MRAASGGTLLALFAHRDDDDEHERGALGLAQLLRLLRLALVVGRQGPLPAARKQPLPLLQGKFINKQLFILMQQLSCLLSLLHGPEEHDVEDDEEDAGDQVHEEGAKPATDGERKSCNDDRGSVKRSERKLWRVFRTLATKKIKEQERGNLQFSLKGILNFPRAGPPITESLCSTVHYCTVRHPRGGPSLVYSPFFPPQRCLSAGLSFPRDSIGGSGGGKISPVPPRPSLCGRPRTLIQTEISHFKAAAAELFLGKSHHAVAMTVSLKLSPFELVFKSTFAGKN